MLDALLHATDVRVDSPIRGGERVATLAARSDLYGGSLFAIKGQRERVDTGSSDLHPARDDNGDLGAGLHANCRASGQAVIDDAVDDGACHALNTVGAAIDVDVPQPSCLCSAVATPMLTIVPRTAAPNAPPKNGYPPYRRCPRCLIG